MIRHGRKARLRSRLRLVLLAIAGVLFLIYLRQCWASHPFIFPVLSSSSSSRQDGPQLHIQKPACPHVDFWAQLQPVLDAYSPSCASPKRKATANAVPFKDLVDDQRHNYMVLSRKDFNRLRRCHRDFVHALDVLPPPPYIPGTRGLVSTAGGDYLPVLMLSLRMLRRTGCELPMEVFLADRSEYEPYVCDIALRNLNARCLVLGDILDTSPAARGIAKYQFKAFAMLFSSFEDTLFMDADAFPLRDPHVVFSELPYHNTGLLTFPDYWASTASPLYYRIAAQSIPSVSVRASTESGIIYVSKRTHPKTLLLATYYNYNGPKYYYPLFSQGAAGEGDKETFLAAASVVDEPFYQVHTTPSAVGHNNDGGGLDGSAIIQLNPLDEFALSQQPPPPPNTSINATSPWRPRPFFVHANFPKFNPGTIFDGEGSIDPIRDPGGLWVRPWTAPADVVAAIGGFEFEASFWREIVALGCQLESTFKSWRVRDKTGICRQLRKYYQFVFEGGEEAAIARLKEAKAVAETEAAIEEGGGGEDDGEDDGENDDENENDEDGDGNNDGNDNAHDNDDGSGDGD